MPVRRLEHPPVPHDDVDRAGDGGHDAEPLRRRLRDRARVLRADRLDASHPPRAHERAYLASVPAQHRDGQLRQEAQRALRAEPGRARPDRVEHYGDAVLGGGAARDPLEGAGVERISEALRALSVGCDRVADDLLVTARMKEW